MTAPNKPPIVDLPDNKKTVVAQHKIAGDRRFHATILDNIENCVFATDRLGKITYWNLAAQNVFGYTSAEMLGEPFTKLSQPKNKKKEAATHLEFLNHETSISIAWEGLDKVGRPVFLQLTYLPMRNNKVELLGLVCVGKDITENKKTEKALHDSESRYRRLFEAARDGIVLLDATTGQITNVNPYLLERLGYTKDEMMSKKIWEIGAKEDIEISKASFKTLQQKGFIHYENIPIKTKDGRLIDFEFVNNIYLVDGSKVVQCNIRDITERKKAENVLRQNEEKLMEQNILLEQKNVALREIMEQNRDEKKRLQNQVQANVENLLNPVIEKIKGNNGVVPQRYITLLEDNLKEITSSFGSSLSSKMLSLTQKEIDVCNMIKNGFGSKEISESLFISTRTVETHRNNIRKKLKISRKEVNLATYLKFLQ